VGDSIQDRVEDLDSSTGSDAFQTLALRRRARDPHIRRQRKQKRQPAEASTNIIHSSGSANIGPQKIRGIVRADIGNARSTRTATSRLRAASDSPSAPDVLSWERHSACAAVAGQQIRPSTGAEGRGSKVPDAPAPGELRGEAAAARSRRTLLDRWCRIGQDDAAADDSEGYGVSCRARRSAPRAARCRGAFDLLADWSTRAPWTSTSSAHVVNGETLEVRWQDGAGLGCR